MITSLYRRFASDDSAATAVEYGLIAALISVAIIAAVQIVGEQLEDTFTEVGTTLQEANQK